MPCKNIARKPDMNRILTVVVLLFLHAGAFADDTAILIPTMYVGPGAFGSTWWSVVIITNHSDAPFESSSAMFRVQCPIPEGCDSPRIEPGQLGVLFSPRPANGLLLYAPAVVAENLAFSAHFGSGPFIFSNGSELPIVREDEFTRRRIHFPASTCTACSFRCARICGSTRSITGSRRECASKCASTSRRRERR